jgi:hypothetical protein
MDGVTTHMLTLGNGLMKQGHKVVLLSGSCEYKVSSISLYEEFRKNEWSLTKREENKIILQKARVIGLLDQDPKKVNTVLEDLNVYSFDSVQDFVKKNVFFIIAIGQAKFSQKVYRELTDLGVKNWISVVHPIAFNSSNTTVGKGVYIGANTILSINAHVNNHSIINQNC